MAVAKCRVAKCLPPDENVYCTLCKTDFSIGAGGVNDIKRHAESKKHSQHEKAVKGSNLMTRYVSTGQEQIDKVSDTD